MLSAIVIIFCLTSLLMPPLLLIARDTADGETLAALAISAIRGNTAYFIPFYPVLSIILIFVFSYGTKLFYLFFTDTVICYNITN